ncbi:polysaccharide biosynthesis/export family protein [Hydrogenophaga sp.]|uniref:polysaccharide biosynthesis/export family protein n=1 Tax=Hydrogenophaga sp. TaxID=1904254 RepID=UPI0027158209|nr:polysaccharide biosynthesis/export family protein [Hydrogenophaga sp.]MDO9439156.1 polysaccharide biosynthesis/export family protein [Hydrogenophaga sp.]
MHHTLFMKTRWALAIVAVCLSGHLHAQTTRGAAEPDGSIAATTQPVPMQPTAVPVVAPAASPSAITPPGTTGAVGPDYRISASDLMEFNVFGVPDMKRDVRVNASGQISLPLIGSVDVAGLTVHSAEQLLAAKYEEKYLLDPQVSLFIKEFTTQRIAIEGAVTRPGIYPVSGELTLLRALALSGGFAPYADLQQIMVYRNGAGGVREQATYDLDKVRSGQVSDPAVRSDDVIVVQRNAKRTALRDSLFRDIIDTLNPFR